MVSLNDYLYRGDTVLKILHNYSADLKASAVSEQNAVDLAHSNFLLQEIELLEHNDFLTSQSQRIREFYKHMADRYPFLAFTFKGRIKSLIRLEEKINGNIVEFIYDHHLKTGTYPSETEIKEQIGRIRDLIAYRIVLSLPECHVKEGEDKNARELELLYEIANDLPGFLEERGFNAEISIGEDLHPAERIRKELWPYFRDYIENPSPYGYQSVHINFYDNSSRCFIEVQLRTHEMDDFAEIGPANHLGCEKRQEKERRKREKIPPGENIYFDNAYERGMTLQNLDLSKLKVNMFGAVDNQLINDGCGLFRGRLILPYEHLSRFQNDLID
ncbi:MAG: guanosine polyphosphate pyrophosphohydrolase [Eubacterium sp.]|nr:guanosine polyphosphate pyrophosphohydrolase [Eubacterium sp.]